MLVDQLDQAEQEKLNKINNTCYRQEEKQRIVASLLAGIPVHVLGEAGCGKTALAEFIAEDLKSRGFKVGWVKAGGAKEAMTQLAIDFSLEVENLEGKSLTRAQIQENIAKFLKSNNGFLIVDDASSVNAEIRRWLSSLYDKNNQPMLVLSIKQQEKDILDKFTDFWLEPLSSEAIREMMKGIAFKLGADFSNSQLATIQQYTGGNPKIAQKEVHRLYAGINQQQAPEHRRWIALDRYLIAGLLIFAIVRVVGQATGDQVLKIIGVSTAAAVTASRLFMAPQPRGVGSRR